MNTITKLFKFCNSTLARYRDAYTKLNSLFLQFFTAPEGQFKNTGDVVKVLLKEQGPKGFFKGAGPVMTRAFPANACCFLGYEAAMRVMNKFAPDS